MNCSFLKVWKTTENATCYCIEIVLICSNCAKKYGLHLQQTFYFILLLNWTKYIHCAYLKKNRFWISFEDLCNWWQRVSVPLRLEENHLISDDCVWFFVSVIIKMMQTTIKTDSFFFFIEQCLLVEWEKKSMQKKVRERKKGWLRKDLNLFIGFNKRMDFRDQIYLFFLLFILFWKQSLWHTHTHKRSQYSSCLSSSL